MTGFWRASNDAWQFVRLVLQLSRVVVEVVMVVRGTHRSTSPAPQLFAPA